MTQKIQFQKTVKNNPSTKILVDHETDMGFCIKCGIDITEEHAEFCPKCGAPVEDRSKPHVDANVAQPDSKPLKRPTEWKSESTTLLLSIILGLFGVQGVGHLYVGKIGKGIAYLIGSLVLFGVAIGLIVTVVGAVIGVPLLVVYFVMFILQILDSRKLCRQYNDSLEATGHAPW